ncbi:Rpn family recombination-promoting nuclease/putative transposase [Pantoea agglomerans]
MPAFATVTAPVRTEAGGLPLTACKTGVTAISAVPAYNPSQKITPAPHDGTFSAFLTRPQTTRDVSCLLISAGFRASCDPGTLRPEFGRFAVEDLRSCYCVRLAGVKVIFLR